MTTDVAPARARRRPLVAVVHDLGSAGPLTVRAAAARLCDVLFVCDFALPQVAADRQSLERVGRLLDLTGLDSPRRSAALREAAPDALTTFGEHRLRQTAQWASALGLPFHSEETVRLLTDKGLQRDRLAERGVDPLRPLRFRADDPQALDDLAALGFPLVVKPRSGAGSTHTHRLDDAVEAEALLPRLPAGLDLVAEPLLPGAPQVAGPAWGDYVSVESAHRGQEHRVLALTGKFPLAPPFRETGMMLPSTLAEADRKAVLALEAGAVRALGIRHGITHTEIKLTPDGPRIIEVNGRVGGYVPEILKRAGGTDLVRAALALALGHDLPPAASGVPNGTVTYQYFLTPPVDCTGVLVRDLDLARVQELPGVLQIDARAGAGRRVDWRQGTQGHLGVVHGAAADHGALAQTAADIEAFFVPALRAALVPEGTGVGAARFRPCPAPESDATLPDLFGRVAARVPGAAAVTDPAGTLTYRQLDLACERVAASLSGRIARGDVVPVVAGPGTTQVAALLGVLRAGGAYLPIAPREPWLRVRHLFEDCGARLALFDGEPPGELPGSVGAIDLRPILAGPSDPTPGPGRAGGPTGPSDRAYVLYTSGSSGRPKGVVVSHRNVVQLVTGQDYVDFDRPPVILQTGAVSFDATTFEIWGALLHGGHLVVPDEDTVLDPAALGGALRRHGITTLWLTAPLFAQLARNDPRLFEPLRELLVGGDVVPARQAAEVIEACPGLRLINGYGPTETTTFATTHLVRAADCTGPLPIGRPLAHTTAQVLDPEGDPVAAGVPGELFIGGEGVALGYLGRPDLTAAVFGDDPLRPGGRRYRTGDRVRERPDGVLEFLGRLDEQVKLRGFRIEPGETAAVLTGHPQVLDAVAVVRAGADGDRHLAAYVIGSTDLDPRELREYLAERLPSQLVPGHVLPVDAFPLTPHGKVDSAALPDPEDFLDNREEHLPPSTATEQMLVKVWEEHLQIAGIGVLDSLFDLGVDSLAAVRLASAASRASGRRVTAGLLLATPRIRELAVAVDDLPPRADGPTPTGPTQTWSPGVPLPLAPQQLPLLAAAQREPDSVRYNVPVLFEVDPDIDPRRLSAAWRQLLARHESLRTGFDLVDGRPVQQVCPPLDPDLEVRTGPPDPERWIRPFDPGRAPLVRSCLSRDPVSGRAWLFTDFHHLVVDGWSLRRLFEELDGLYRGEELPAAQLQYRHLLARWTGPDAGEHRRALLESWRADLSRPAAGRPWERADLPTDRPRAAGRRDAGAVLTFEVAPRTVAALTALGRRRGTTLFGVLASLYCAFLHSITGDGRVLTAFPVAGRSVPGDEEVIGMVTGTAGLLVDVRDGLTVDQLVDRVSERITVALARQDLPLADLARFVPGAGVEGRGVVDAFFAFHGRGLLEGHVLGRPVPLRPLFPGEPMFDLNLQLFEQRDGSLRAEWEYSAHLFETATVAWFARLFTDGAQAAGRDPQITVGRLAGEPAESAPPGVSPNVAGSTGARGPESLSGARDPESIEFDF
ncbi:MAG: hypothetical protein QG608_2420 [Actinomycetota bacterium]|nr:hypothetical protein [Actinomycetota bacterium]